MAEVEKARQELGRTLDVLDRALKDRKDLAVDTLSLADVTFMPGLQFLLEAKQEDLIIYCAWIPTARRQEDPAGGGLSQRVCLSYQFGPEPPAAELPLREVPRPSNPSVAPQHRGRCARTVTKAADKVRPA